MNYDDSLIGTKQNGGQLTVIKLLGSKKINNTSTRYLLCRCSCGKEKEVTFSNFKSKLVKSCGHLLSTSKVKHGHAFKNRDMMSATYKSWQSMKTRCKRGYSSLYEYWNNFNVFLNDMGNCPSDGYSIDRIDGTKGYCPENCRWATKKQQAQNTTRALKIEYNGKLYSRNELCRDLNVSAPTVKYRMSIGKTIYEAIQSPIENFKEPKDSEIVKQKSNFYQNKKLRGFNNKEDDLTFEQWIDIKNKYKSCYYCNRSEEEILNLGLSLTRDHIMPKLKGGHDTYNNIVPACGPCNRSKRINDKPKLYNEMNDGRGPYIKKLTIK